MRKVKHQDDVPAPAPRVFNKKKTKKQNTVQRPKSQNGPVKIPSIKSEE